MSESRKKVAIIGGGFGGLRAAQRLAGKNLDVTLIDRKNHHTFQPLLYQVATAVLSPGQIAVPIRRILFRAKNIEVVLGSASEIDKEKKKVILEAGNTIDFDYLIVAAGARHSYFGNEQWEDSAPGLKTIEDAIEIRRRVLLAFEVAEREAIIQGKHEPLNFIVVGAGPTGVEIAGAIAGIARNALSRDFKAIDTQNARVILLEGGDRVLNTFSESLSEKAKSDLEELGVEVRLNSFVDEVVPGRVRVGEEWFESSVTVWATGVQASPLGASLSDDIDSAGRVPVNPDLSVEGADNIFVIGDMAHFKNEDGTLVPGVAPAATQMADIAAKNILNDLSSKERETFSYFDKGSMATIGKSRAVVEAGRFKLTGFFAWLAWLFVHVLLLIGFRNRILVISEWFWAYLTRERSARLITGGEIEITRSFLSMRSNASSYFGLESKPDREKIEDTKS